MKSTFTYTVLRYVHDIATGEFVNMGVALYAPEAKYISAVCTPRYGRLSKMFLEVNGEHLKSITRFIQARFEEHGTKFKTELPLGGVPKSIMDIAHSILPRDDSSLQWSEPNGGNRESKNFARHTQRRLIFLTRCPCRRTLFPSRRRQNFRSE